MKRKKVWRYYCDFCKKSNCSAASISHHEKRCTLNPDRHCGMCAIVDLPQKPMPELIELLKDIRILEDKEYDGLVGVSINYILHGDMDAALERLRDETENCPACILAALRQKGIPVPMTKFNFTNDVKEFWGNYNDNQRRMDEESNAYYG